MSWKSVCEPCWLALLIFGSWINFSTFKHSTWSLYDPASSQSSASKRVSWLSICSKQAEGRNMEEAQWSSRKSKPTLCFRTNWGVPEWKDKQVQHHYAHTHTCKYTQMHAGSEVCACAHTETNTHTYIGTYFRGGWGVYWFLWKWEVEIRMGRGFHRTSRRQPEDNTVNLFAKDESQRGVQRACHVVMVCLTCYLSSWLATVAV